MKLLCLNCDHLQGVSRRPTLENQMKKVKPRVVETRVVSKKWDFFFRIMQFLTNFSIAPLNNAQQTFMETRLMTPTTLTIHESK